MADIDIVPKRRMGAWVWLLIAVVIAIVLWMVLAGGNRAPDTGMLQAPASQRAAAAFTTAWSC